MDLGDSARDYILLACTVIFHTRSTSTSKQTHHVDDNMPNLSIPTSSALPSHQLISSTNPAVSKILGRLSRPSLITLALDWLDTRNQENIATCLAPEEQDQDDDENDPYPPARSLQELRKIYNELQTSKGSKRDVLDRIIEGDWRNGISLYQIAMADMQHLYDHASSQKWSALKVIKLESERDDKRRRPASVPRFHPSTFLRNLQEENLPDVKAHYNLDRHATLPLLILRIFVLESPYNTNHALRSTTQFDSSKTFYVAFPDASPYVYVSLTTSIGPSSISSEAKSLRKLTLDGIPKAFSKPRDRYTWEPTQMSARNLEALVQTRGGGKTNAAGGGWGIYAEDNKTDTPLHPQRQAYELATSVSDEENAGKAKMIGMKRRREEDANVVKRRKLVAQGRFGNSAKADDGKGVERLDVRIEDPFPSSSRVASIMAPADDAEKQGRKKGRRSTISFELDRLQRDEDMEEDANTWRPDVRITFKGQHVFAGIRSLVEEGIIDGEKMPGWMTGEENISLGVVRNGRMKGFKGSGL